MTILKLSILISSLTFFGISTCYGQQNVIDKYHSNYEVGTIPDLDGFKKLQKYEMRMDSLIPEYDPLTRRGPFILNRSRIFLDMYENGIAQEKDSSYYPGLPTVCTCETTGDTTFIRFGIGFFGGFGFITKVYEGKFESSFFEYTDDVKPFKTDLSDTAFHSSVKVDNKYQKLILKDKLLHKYGQQITGLLYYRTDDYYKKNYSDSVDTVYMAGRVFFTCKTDGIRLSR